MDFALPQDVLELRERLRAFLAEHVLPREAELTRAIDDEVAPGVAYPAAIRELRARARAEGLWNLWLANHHEGPGLTNVAYGVLCEEMGRAMYVAPAIFNCSFPDTGNAEALLDYGTPEQVEEFARPLLDDDVRSCFALTEPDAASSDPTNISTSARLDGGEWVLDGHKWWISGATGASFAIVMAVTEPDAPQHARASMLLVPTGADGFEIVRALPLMGHAAGYGHCELRFHGVRIPAGNVLGGRGEGFAVAQARLGPGRIHHCMRAIGGAERAFELMCRRANERVTRGEPLADKQMVQDWVARSRIEIDTARLSVLHAAWTIDTVGKKAARQQIAQIKVQVAQMLCEVVDRAIQVHGALGLSDDTPLVSLYRMGRALRFGDGPDEVHKLTIARRELARFAPQ
jgi:acyl-CoA dehydrogenase